MANKIIHKHSSVITDGKAKLPTASQLEYGELAINYADGVETISMKNSANEIVEIKTTNYLEKIIIDNELVTAAALTNLDERIEEVDSTFSDAISKTNEKVTKNELVTAHALTDLDDRLKTVEDGVLDMNGKYVTIQDYEETEFVTATVLTELGDQIETINTVIEENEYITATALTDLNKRLTNIEENGGGSGDVGDLSDYAKANHTHGTINLTGDVTGSGTIGSGTTAINITATVANNSHTHTSANISDSISAASGITSSATGLVQGKAVQAYAASKSELDALIAEVEDNEYVTALAVTELESRVTAIEEGSGNGSSNDHTHGTINLTGDVTGSGTIGSGTTAINITTVVANNSHTHTSANITDSISASSGITSSASGLVQGKAVQAYAAPKTHNHGTITLSGDVTGSATISGTNAVNITATVANNSHTHTSANISDSISVSTNITSSATGLVQGKAVYGIVSTIETKLNDRINTLVTDIEDNEYVTALAVTELETRVAQLEQTIATLQETLANVNAQLANTLTVE